MYDLTHLTFLRNFVSSYDLQQEVLVISDLIQNSQAHKYATMLLLIAEQQMQKVYKYPPLNQALLRICLLANSVQEE